MKECKDSQRNTSNYHSLHKVVFIFWRIDGGAPFAIPDIANGNNEAQNVAKYVISDTHSAESIVL